LQTSVRAWRPVVQFGQAAAGATNPSVAIADQAAMNRAPTMSNLPLTVTASARQSFDAFVEYGLRPAVKQGHRTLGPGGARV